MIEAVYLYILLQRGDTSTSVRRYAHPSYQSCFAALKQVRIVVAVGDDNEAVAIAYCAGRQQILYTDGSFKPEAQP